MSIEEFLQKRSKCPVIDVRSPSEYKQGHIPGAVNIPLFQDEERAIVGTLYKQRGKYEAVKAGLDLLGPKLSAILRRSRRVIGNSEALIYCWRGGLRSESIAWLLNLSAIKCQVLKDGYKAYRRFHHTIFLTSYQLMVLGGPTGSGKTEVLHQIKMKGHQVIDLEDLANHKGSVFGGIGNSSQPTTEQFQNNLFEAFYALDRKKPIWVENENQVIGNVVLPEIFYDKIINSPLIQLQVSKNIRVQRLVNDYGPLNKEEITKAISKIEKRLGNLNMKTAINALEKGDLIQTADILLTYYDKAYHQSFDQKRHNCICTIKTDEAKPDKLAEKIFQNIKEGAF